MHRAERIVYVDIGKLRSSRLNPSSSFSSSGENAGSREGTLSRPQVSNDFLRRIADAVLGQSDSLPKQLREAQRARLERVLLVGALLRPSEVAREMTRAPRSMACLMVGSASRMRESSVMLLPSSGTLKSMRMNTRCSRSADRGSTDAFERVGHEARLQSLARRAA